MADDDMSRTDFRIAFDGEALASHTMNVRDLAPSLLAIGDIFAEANKLLNGPDAKIEVHVSPNIKERCFDIGLEVFQSWETIKQLLKSSDVTTAKELADWLLLNKEIAATSIGSLILLYKAIKKRKPISVMRFHDENGNALYRYQFDGGKDQILDEKLYTLYQSRRIRQQLARLLAPVLKLPGVSRFVAYREDKTSAEVITKEDAQDFNFEVDEPPEKPTQDDEPIEAMLRVYSPVYDLTARNWRFWYGDEHHYMNVSESNIGQVVHENGGALIDDRFRVNLVIKTTVDEDGKVHKDYLVKDVIEFVPALRQPDLFLQHVDAERAPKEPESNV